MRAVKLYKIMAMLGMSPQLVIYKSNMTDLYLAQANKCVAKFLDPSFSLESRKNLAKFISSNLSLTPNGNTQVNELMPMLEMGLEKWREKSANNEANLVDLLQRCCHHAKFFSIWNTFFNPPLNPSPW